MKVRAFVLLNIMIVLISLSGLVLTQGNPSGTPPPRPGDEQGSGGGSNREPLTICPTGERFVTAESGLVIVADGKEWLVPMVVNEGTVTIGFVPFNSSAACFQVNYP